MQALKTVIVDDNKAFVVLARHLLARCARIEVIGTGHDGYDAVASPRSCGPISSSWIC